MKHFETIFQEVDVIVTPTSASGTFKVKEIDLKC